MNTVKDVLSSKEPIIGTSRAGEHGLGASRAVVALKAIVSHEVRVNMQADLARESDGLPCASINHVHIRQLAHAVYSGRAHVKELFRDGCRFIRTVGAYLTECASDGT